MEQCEDFNVQVVDDHQMMRLGLIAQAKACGRLKLQWIESSNLGDALDAFDRQSDIDLVLLDLNLPDSQGLQGLQRFLARFPAAHVAVFSATEDEFVMRQALALGAVGFVPKSAAAAITLRLVESLLVSGRSLARTESAGWLPASAHGPRRPLGLAPLMPGASKHTEALTLTQLRVLELLLAGMTNHEIAGECQLAQGTVKNTVSSLMLALDVRSRSHLVSVFR